MKLQKAVYIGRRITQAKKLAYFWHFDGEERPRGWTGQVAPAKIGESWTITLSDNGGVYTGGQHKPLQASLSDAPVEKVREWQAADVAHAQDFAERKAMRKLAARKSEFDQTMQPLLAMYDTLRTHDERQAFMMAVQKKFIWRS
jgi:hypothetical protein